MRGCTGNTHAMRSAERSLARTLGVRSPLPSRLWPRHQCARWTSMYMRPGQNRPSPSPSARPASERCRLRLLEGLPALVHDVAHARSICPRTRTLPGTTPRHARTAISRACVHLRSRAQAPRAVLGRPRRCHGVLKFDLQGYFFRELRLSRVFPSSLSSDCFFSIRNQRFETQPTEQVSCLGECQRGLCLSSVRASAAGLWHS